MLTDREVAMATQSNLCLCVCLSSCDCVSPTGFTQQDFEETFSTPTPITTPNQLNARVPTREEGPHKGGESPQQLTWTLPNSQARSRGVFLALLTRQGLDWCCSNISDWKPTNKHNLMNEKHKRTEKIYTTRRSCGTKRCSALWPVSNERNTGRARRRRGPQRVRVMAML